MNAAEVWSDCARLLVVLRLLEAVSAEKAWTLLHEPIELEGYNGRVTLMRLLEMGRYHDAIGRGCDTVIHGEIDSTVSL
jgi:hypothetical protein